MSTLIARCLCGPRHSARPRLVADAAPRASAKSDPTGTTPIVRRWSRDLDQRWATIKRMLPQAVQNSANPVNMIHHSVLTGKGDPVHAFQSWLDEAMRQVVVGVNGAWLLRYVREASDVGALRAKELAKSDEIGADRTHILQSLTITELQGIVEAVSQQLVRTFTNGILARQTPAAIVGQMRVILDKVGSQRGQLLASFMCVKAHAAATLDAFRAAGIDRVGLVPECLPSAAKMTTDAKQSKKGKVYVLTAEDDRVCPECEEIAADGPYYLDEAEHLIPRHPRCRCAFLPADPKEREEVLGDSATHIAAGVMITADNTGRTLFLRRAAKHGDHGGEWAFPAGAIEPGETVEQGAARETREEIGYDPSDDMEQAHRAETNGVDFTTYMHSTPTEFRPHLNEEHDAYRWATIGSEAMPSPLHPGVARTLYTMGDEFKEELHPRDKDGKFATKAGSGSSHGIEHEVEAKTLVSIAKKEGYEVQYHPPEGGNKSHSFVTNVQNADKLKALLEKNGNHFKTVPGSGVIMFKVPNSDDNVETQHGTYEEHKTQAAGVYNTTKPTAPHTAAPPPHPLEKHLPHVSGTSSERVALRNKIKGMKYSDPELKTLQERHNASFWKQHQQLTKKGKLDEAKEIADKLDKYSKSYGISNPLKYSIAAKPVAPIPVPISTGGKKYDISTPHGNFAQSLENEKIPHTTGVFGPNSPHHGQQYVAFGAATDNQKDLVKQIAKYHPQMEPIQESQTIYKPKIAGVAPKPVFGKAVPKAPQPELNFADLKKVGEQKGSNPGGVYEDATGNRYYIKSMSKERAQNELLAAKLYQLSGAPTLDYVPVKPDGDTHYVATKFEALDKSNISQFGTSELKEAREHFATHAWLANWDAAGTGGDNQGVKNGVVKTLDVGGALEYRAKGTPKGAAFGTKVDEFDTLRDASKNPDTHKLFGKMTDEQIKQSVDTLTSNVTAADIRNTVESVYGVNSKSKALADKLIDRKSDLVARADALGKAASAPDLSHMSEEDQRVHWLKKTIGDDSSYLSYHMGTKDGVLSANKKNKLKDMGLTDAEVGFIRAFTGPSSSVNAQMRDGHMDDHVFAFKHIMNEALDKFPVYDGPMVWRKISVGQNVIDKYVPGKIVHWQAFSSTSKNPDTWTGNLHFTIRNPKSGRDVQFISENPSEAEVIMPADTYYRVLSKKQSGGDTIVELEEVVPFGKKQKKAA